MPLTVLAIADEVTRSLYDCFQPERWQNIDLIVSCGDLDPTYLDFLTSNLNVPLFYVRGNHDGKYESARYQGFQSVHGRILEYRGVRIAGFEGSMRYSGGGQQYRERDMQLLVQRLRLQSVRRGAPDIVVTHAPPAGPHAGADVCHSGFDAFVTAIDAWKPEYLVHGHMHAYDGRQQPYTVGATTVLNAFPYKVFEVEERPATRHAAGNGGNGHFASVKRFFP